MRVLLFSLLLLSSSILCGQIQISGKIVDAKDGQALAGASIQESSGALGTVSNEDGFFSILTSADSLQVSFIGYEGSYLSQLIDGAFYTVELISNNVLGGVTVTARPPQVGLRTPEAVAFLSRPDLTRFQELSPATALNQIPGVYMQSGALNTNRITIRGIGNRIPFGTAKIRAYLDEIPITNGVGETSIEDIDLSFLNNIQVWKGPTASNYGAALGGMIHLQTGDGSRPGFQLNSSSEWGEFGLERQVAQFNYYNPKNKLQLSLNFNDTHSDGYRDNNEYDRESFTLLGKIGSGNRHRTTFLVNYTDLKAFIPSSLSEDDFRNEPSKAAFTWAQVMGFEDNQRLITGIAHQYDWWLGAQGKSISSHASLFGTYRNNYESRPFNILRESNWSGGYRITLDYRNGRQRQTPNAQIGIETYTENYQWTTNETDGGELRALLSDNEERRRYFNLFASWDWAIGPQWFVKAGLNLNSTGYELTDYFLTDSSDLSGDYQFDAILSPRLSIGYQWNPQVSIFATVSHGFSPPTLEETLNPDGSRNNEIQPEQGWNFELGSRGSYINGKFHYDLSIYRMQIRDLLVARRTGLDQFIGINAGKTIHQGLEVSLRYDWLDGPWQISTQGNYNYANYSFDEFVDGENDFSGNELTGTPPHQFNTWLDVRSPFGVYASLNFEYVDAFPMRDDNSIYSEAYQLVNTRIGWRKTWLTGFNFEIYAGLNNLFDERYASMILINAASFGGRAPRYYYPGLPRNWYGGVKIGYTL